MRSSVHRPWKRAAPGVGAGMGWDGVMGISVSFSLGGVSGVKVDAVLLCG